MNRLKVCKAAQVIVLSILSYTVTGCNSSSSDRTHQATTDPHPAIQTFSLTSSDSYTVQREYVGMVQAGQQANLGVELGGKIAQLFVDVGDNIKAGEPIVRLDTQLLLTQADQLRAQKAQIKAQLVLIEANLKRQNALKTKGFSADAEIDNLSSQRNALKANLRQLDASLAANQLQRDKSTVYAPYDGTVSARYVSKGDVVGTGSPTVTLLASTNKEAHIGIPAKQLAKLVTDGNWVIRIGQSSYPVTLLNPGARVDLGSRTVKLRFALPEDVQAIDGELAYLQFNDRHNSTGYWIPLSAMTDGLRGVWNVFIVNKDNNNEQRIERRSIQVLYANNDNAFITGAIASGDLIVASGLHRLVPGQQVTPIVTPPVSLIHHPDRTELPHPITAAENKAE
ncbi:RND transporter [Photobacterium aquae]|uniref:RND transporter n=1 Tax=Photobacterium aquae TaxID=1195763 RepID=A0A0J1H068_9GAMM|nr:efflux RND transporter periplasmic adaptor subunit [Photobacterium aquae]KLV05221.1 RND transporter [Photobacterium aquae]